MRPAALSTHQGGPQAHLPEMIRNTVRSATGPKPVSKSHNALLVHSEEASRYVHVRESPLNSPRARQDQRRPFNLFDM